MAILASETPADSIAISITTSWNQYASMPVDITGDVTSVTVRLTTLTALGTTDIQFRLVRNFITISTGSKDSSTIPSLPTGSPDGIEYVITMSSVRIAVGETIQLESRILNGSAAVWIHGTAPNAHTIVTGDELSAPTKANTPSPTNANTSVTLDQAILTWVDGGGADTFDVYYGTVSGSLTLVSSAQAGTSFTVTGITDGSPFAYLSTRYWRIDSTNDAGTTTGDEWSFITIRLDPPGKTYFYTTTGQYYYLLVQSDGSYGDPPGVGIENTDFVYLAVGYEANFMSTTRKLVSCANSKVWIEDI